MFWTTIRSIHLLAMAFFVGGQLLLAFAVVPVIRSSGGDQLRLVARRFGYGTLVAIGVLLATGAMLAGQYGRWNDPTLHQKMTLVALVGGLIIWHMRKPKLHALQAIIFVLSLALLWLGAGIAH
jgi:uncharacterized membrane protein